MSTPCLLDMVLVLVLGTINGLSDLMGCEVVRKVLLTDACTVQNAVLNLVLSGWLLGSN